MEIQMRKCGQWLLASRTRVCIVLPISFAAALSICYILGIYARFVSDIQHQLYNQQIISK